LKKGENETVKKINHSKKKALDVLGWYIIRRNSLEKVPAGWLEQGGSAAAENIHLTRKENRHTLQVHIIFLSTFYKIRVIKGFVT